MSLFQYTGRLINGAEKSGRITAKSEEAARALLTRNHSVVEVITISEQPVPRPAPVATSTNGAPVHRANPLKRLQKLLYLQSGRCFFCGEELPASEASIEHLHPKSKGGTGADDNIVVCHTSLNQIFGNLDVKRKFEFVIKSAGAFKCPRNK